MLAVDPSSPFTGGALLGDRIRMQEHRGDDGVFIRSMATRGHLGGLAASAPQAVRVLDAAGCDVVLVETVGVGQSEVEVAGLADTTVVLLAPGMGDAIQAAKAGILEIGDVYCVNKADRDGADATARELRRWCRIGRNARAARSASVWRPPIVQTVASRGEGIDELARGDRLAPRVPRGARSAARAAASTVPAPRSRRSCCAPFGCGCHGADGAPAAKGWRSRWCRVSLTLHGGRDCLRLPQLTVDRGGASSRRRGR